MLMPMIMNTTDDTITDVILKPDTLLRRNGLKWLFFNYMDEVQFDVVEQGRMDSFSLKMSTKWLNHTI